MTYCDQYDAIMYLLAQGSDLNCGHVGLYSDIFQQEEELSKDKFIELFCRIIEEYGADVNYQD
jgi:hypothetical protein